MKIRCSSGSVSWLTSMTGGWYVCIMDIGRDDGRESGRGCEPGELKSLSWVTEETEKEDAFGGFSLGECGVGEAAFDEGVRRFDEWPPHSDMKESTENARTEASISECCSW